MTPDTALEGVQDLKDQLTSEFCSGQSQLVQRLFAQHDATAPFIIWSPLPKDLRHPLMARFDHLCNEALQTRGRVLQKDFEFERFASLHDWMMMIDIIDDGADFAYLHYGQGIAEQFGNDMTGRLTSELAGHIGPFFSALYRAMLVRKEPVLSEHEPPRRVFVRSWRRLIVPLFDAFGKVSRIAAINLPENEFRAGLEIIPDPVFVVDESGVIRFANRAAQSLFPSAALLAKRLTLNQCCGFDVGVDASPLQLYESHRVENRICRLRVGDMITDDFVITVSAAIHANHAFYVVMIRMITS